MEVILKNVIEKQKSVLETSLKEIYVERTKYQEIKDLVKTDLIKVIIGPRRTGKSVLALMMGKNLKFAYLNFDEEGLVPFLEKSKDYNLLLKEMLAVYGETKFLIFDEIQNLDNWELFINRLHREGYNIILTGSNAKLLSKELATHLTGRCLQIEIFPFSFEEFLSANEFNSKADLSLPENKGRLLNLLDAFMNNGGYPEVVTHKLDHKNYLAQLFDATIFKDVVKRYRVRNFNKIFDLGIYLINNIGNELSYSRLAKILEVKSVVSVVKYVSFLEESYLLFILGGYSYKTGERLKSLKKMYVVDNGFITAKAVQLSPNKGKLMENLVFTELLKRNFHPNLDLFYYRTRNNKEIDFVLKKGYKVDQLVQVAFDLPDITTEKREVKALLEASGELKCDDLALITWDREEIGEINGKKIKFIPLWKWLLKV